MVHRHGAGRGSDGGYHDLHDRRLRDQDARNRGGRRGDDDARERRQGMAVCHQPHRRRAGIPSARHVHDARG